MFSEFIRKSCFQTDKKILMTLKIGTIFELMVLEKPFKECNSWKRTSQGFRKTGHPCVLPLVSRLLRLIVGMLNYISTFWRDFIDPLIHSFNKYTQIQDSERWGHQGHGSPKLMFKGILTFDT